MNESFISFLKELEQSLSLKDQCGISIFTGYRRTIYEIY